MKTKSYLKLVTGLLLAVSVSACGGDAWECVGEADNEACVREVCLEDGTGCTLEVRSQAMTKAKLAELLCGPNSPVVCR